jgi:hypothetical protein
MGDFERTFGVGADSVGIIESLAKGSGGRSAFVHSPSTQTSRKNPTVYSEQDFEVDPEGVPQSRHVIFTTYAAMARWDARNADMQFTRCRDDNGMFVMTMVGSRPHIIDVTPR